MSHFCPAELLKVSPNGFALSCVQAFESAVPSVEKAVCHPSFSSESLSWSFTNALTCHSVFMFLSSLPDFKICTPFTLIHPAPNTRCSEYLARTQLDGWVSGWMDGEINRWALSTVRPNRVLMVMTGIPLEHRQVRWSPQTEMKETADVRKFLC